MGLVRKLAPIGSRRRAVVVRPVRRVVRFAQIRLAPDHALRDEEGKLKQSWARFSADALDAYLVSGYQNPRINPQSMLTRHHLVRELFGKDFDELAQAELQFCVETNEAIRKRAAELGVKMGSFTNPDQRAAVDRVCEVIAHREREFEQRWHDALAPRSAEPIRVLEMACGSANDYRSLVDYGIARFLDYTGIDLNERNIANAKARFPDVDFQVGSILSLPYEDGSYDYVIAFDIFEHLSLEAMDSALGEAMRLARRGVIFAFFIMRDMPEHKSRPVRRYHWNELSAAKMAERLRQAFTDVQVTHLTAMLRETFGYRRFYNSKAYTIIAQGRG